VDVRAEMERSHQRAIRPLRDGNASNARIDEQIERVPRRVRDARVTADGRDCPHIEFRPRERKQDPRRIVHAGVAIENNRYRHRHLREITEPFTQAYRGFA
jgi:hypothetical protein